MTLGTNPDIVIRYQWNESETPLMYAVREGSERMVRFLLSRTDSYVNHETREGETALRTALKVQDLGKPDAVLQNDSTNANLATRYGLGEYGSALHRIASDCTQRALLNNAALHANLKLLMLLPAHDDTDLSTVDDMVDYTPIMNAAESGHLEFVNLLLTVPEALRNLWRKNCDDKTMLEFAAQSFYLLCVKRLLEPALDAPMDVVREAVESMESYIDGHQNLDDVELANAENWEECRRLLQERLAQMESTEGNI
ncbi:ankyrin repeat-containing domain protein [Aspergillus venezuelensis]